MKKLCAILALTLLSIGLLVACGKKDTTTDVTIQGEPIPDASSTTEDIVEETEPDIPPAEGRQNCSTTIWYQPCRRSLRMYGRRRNFSSDGYHPGLGIFR